MTTALIEEMPPMEKKGRPKGRKKFKAIQLRAPEDVAEALAGLADKQMRTQNQELLLALLNHLRTHNALPLRLREAEE